jgi:Protein of unknown function (DUF3106)
MGSCRLSMIAVLAGMSLVPVFAEPQDRPPPPRQRQLPPRLQRRLDKLRENPPGEELFDRLMRMNPAEREKALSQLPPLRRALIERRIRDFQGLPPAAQEQRLERLERLNSLPPQKQDEVRRSMRELPQLPNDRRPMINQELQRLSKMPEDERQARMNSEDFRNRYSPDEQHLIANLSQIY